MVFVSDTLKRDIYIAPFTMQGGVRVYGTPVLYRWNWRTLSSGADMMAFGPEYINHRKAVVPNAEIVGIKQFDRVWMDVAPSATLDPLAKDADFYVLSADAGAGGVATVFFKRLSPDG